MNSVEYCQNQVEHIDRHLLEIRVQMEALRQAEEFLTAQRERWVGRLAAQNVSALHTPVERTLTLIMGEREDNPNPSA